MTPGVASRASVTQVRQKEELGGDGCWWQVRTPLQRWILVAAGKRRRPQRLQGAGAPDLYLHLQRHGLLEMEEATIAHT